MGDHIDEAAGNVKATVGKATGNEQMQREGQAQSSAAHVSHEVKGAVDQGVGKVQEGVGKVTGDKSTEAAGKARQAEGTLNRAG